MELNALLALVEKSDSEDWFALPSLPLATWDSWQGPGDKWGLAPVFYSGAHAHRGDVDVVLAWGAESATDKNRNLKKEGWVTQGHFPDPEAPPTEVVLRYRGQPIEDWSFVYLDGHRLLVPIPEPVVAGTTVTGYYLPREKQAIGNLVFGLFVDDVTWPNLRAVMDRCGVKWE